MPLRLSSCTTFSLLEASVRRRGEGDAGELVAVVDGEAAERVLDVGADRGAVVLGEVLQRQRDRPGGIGDQAQVLVGVGELERARELLGAHLGKAGGAQERLDPGGLGHAEWPRSGRRGRRQDVAALGEADAGDREERVALERAPDGERKAPTRAQPRWVSASAVSGWGISM